MEALPEQGTLLSSFLTTPTTLKDPPAILPIQHNLLLLLMQQTWQGTSYNSAWVRSAIQEHQFQSNLPALVLGIHQPTPHSGSMSFGITSTFRTLPSFPGEAIPTDPDCWTWNTPLSHTGTSPYRSPSNLPPLQLEDCPQSSHSKQKARPRQDSDHLDHPEGGTTGQRYTDPRNSPGETQSPLCPSIPETGEQQRLSKPQLSEESMRRWEGSPVPSTSPLATPARRYSPLQHMSMGTHGEALTLPQPQPPQKLPTPPCQATLLTLAWAFYLLSMGKLTAIPEILFHAPLIDLFNHFICELVEDPDWAVTPAGMDYTHYRYSYILKEEARHFACIAFNMIHQEQTIEVPAR
ncbi:hypothetical protein ARMGADRAFT_1092766 [Armillaria gallica]|uniref:Uncharacterized protein n=1 Tax=Armillaria gallica TaxID=47427 RepID=A0A2H3CN12_ARMGA|nr:hypothetical protein ARMGADRAFT_1092766 [Armillaria gallica]